jgi:hypothetical protein
MKQLILLLCIGMVLMVLNISSALAQDDAIPPCPSSEMICMLERSWTVAQLQEQLANLGFCQIWR